MPHGLAPALLAALLLLGGCGDDGRPADQTARVTVALQADAATLDPHAGTDAGSLRMTENIYSTLMRYTRTYGNVEPNLLSEHEANDHFTQWTLTLRPGLRFHSGNRLTAKDVVYSLQRIQTIRGGQAAALVDLQQAEVIDERTVRLTFEHPMAPLLTYLAHPNYAIVDRQVVEANDGDLDNADAGSGPFRLVEWQRDRRLILERFDDYHEKGMPRLERVVYRPIPDEASRSVALATGAVDILLDVPVQEVANLRTAEGVRLESVPGTFWEYIGLNTTVEPFDDPRVRRAVSWALDRQALVEVVKRGHATVLDGAHIPPHHWAHADLQTYPKRDVAKAKQLLAEAGYADGFDAALLVGSDFPYQVRAGEVVKQMLADAGMRIDLRQLESTQFFTRLGASDFQMTIVGWVGFVDPDQWVWNLFRGNGPFNQQRYANPRVDELMRDGRSVRAREERRAIYRALLKILAEDAPMVFLYCNNQITAMRDDIEGFPVHPTASTTFLRTTRIVTDSASASEPNTEAEKKTP